MVPCDRAAEMYDGSYADRQGMISPSVQIPEVPVEHIRHMALSVAGSLLLDELSHTAMPQSTRNTP